MHSRAGLRLELLIYALASCCFWVSYFAVEASEPNFKPGQREVGVIRVLTWNLGTGVDQGTEGLRNGDIDAVAAVISALDPELVFLQELTGRHQLRALSALLGDGWDWKLGRIEAGRPLGVMCQRGALIELDAAFLDRAQAVEYIHESGLRLSAVGLHADAFSSKNRNQSIGRASEYLQRADAGQRVLLAGDLNLDLGIDKRRDLFTDDEYLDVETYNFLATSMLDAGLGMGPTAKPDRRIDYIFVRRLEFEVLQAGPWPGQRASGMDHHPLLADLKPTR